MRRSRGGGAGERRERKGDIYDEEMGREEEERSDDESYGGEMEYEITEVREMIFKIKYINYSNILK